MKSIKIKNNLIFYFLVAIVVLNILPAKAEIKDWSRDNNINGSINSIPKSELGKLDEVIVAVIDTGIDPSHKELKNKIVTMKNGKFVSARQYDYGRDFSPRSLTFKRPYDENGHGTHIASIITSIAPNAKILPIKYFNKDATEKENLDATIDAIKYAINLGVKIINYSSGGSGMSLAEKEVINLANENGVLLIAAAGNFGENIDEKDLQYYPASYNHRNIISVINHGVNFKLHKTSNYGKHGADISAPGTNILGAFPNSRYGNLTGTSQSTAFVSATAAILKGIFTNISHTKVKELIIKGSNYIPALKNKCISSGALDIKRTVKLAEKYTKRKFASTKQKSHP